jgi:cell division protein FtsQ
VWPATLVIHIDEQRPVAAWGEAELLSAGGERFRPARRPAGLPRLAGPEGSHGQVLERYRSLQRALAAAGLELAALSLDARRAWQARLAGGAALELGRQDIEARVERFAAAWPRLVAGRGGHAPESVDLRYPNGFAVRWAAPADSGEEAVK